MHTTAQKLFIFFVRRLSIPSLLLCPFQECQKKSNEALILISLLRLLLLLVVLIRSLSRILTWYLFIRGYTFFDSRFVVRYFLYASSDQRLLWRRRCRRRRWYFVTKRVSCFFFLFFFFLSHSKRYTIEGIALKRNAWYSPQICLHLPALFRAFRLAFLVGWRASALFLFFSRRLPIVCVYVDGKNIIAFNECRVLQLWWAVIISLALAVKNLLVRMRRCSVDQYMCRRQTSILFFYSGCSANVVRILVGFLVSKQYMGYLFIALFSLLLLLHWFFFSTCFFFSFEL